MSPASRSALRRRAPVWFGLVASLAAPLFPLPTPAAEASLPETAPADRWPSFRGTPSLAAVSAAHLPDRPTLKWSFKTGGPVKSTAAIVDGTAYVGSEDGKVYALSLADGAKKWEFTADGPVVSSPLIHQGSVYIGSAGTNFFALDAQTGRERWRYGADAEFKSSASVFHPPGSKATWLVIGGYDNRLHCVDAANGRTNWLYETGNYVNGAPAIGGGLTAFGGCDAIVHVVNLANGSKAREVEAGAYIIGSAAVVEGVAYVGHYENEFLAIDLQKGEILWRYRDRAFPYGGSPAVTRDRVLFGSRDKRLHCVERATGKVVWTFATRGKLESSPVVATDRVVVGSDDGRVYLLSLPDGKELWNYEIGQPVQASPAVVQGHFLIGAEDGVIYAFGPP
ncbi:MAG: PQQ-binding-like beta-propeller repeat protein [Verrucomicrobiales bacterium]|nr:PQQ-binding-like beta-propeller repeat protein [Verrucomicrobiales bacterium]